MNVRGMLEVRVHKILRIDKFDFLNFITEVVCIKSGKTERGREKC